MAVRYLATSVSQSTSGGVVATASIGAAGTGYTALDVLTLTGGIGTATVRVDTVGGSGDVTGITLLTGGGGYSVATVATTGGTGSNCTISIDTLSGSWKLCETANISTAFNANSYRDDVNTTRYSAAFTTTVGRSLQSVALALFFYATRSGNITVTLQENTGSWGDVAGTAVTVANNTTNFPVNFSRYLFTFTSAGTGTANQFRIKVSCDTASRIQWCRSSTAGDYDYAVIGNGADTLKLASGDTAIIGQGITWTIDENTTVGPTNNRSVVFCYNSTFTWAASPAASYTFDLGAGVFSTTYAGGIAIGSSGSRQANATRPVITTSYNGAMIEIPNYTYFAATNNFTLDLFGAIPADAFAISLTGDTETSSNRISVASVPASWSVGDDVKLVAKQVTTGGDNVSYKINAIGAGYIDLGDSVLNNPLNVNYKCLTGGRIVNKTYADSTLGIKIASSVATNTNCILATAYNLDLLIYRYQFDGLELYDMGMYTPSTATTSDTCFAKNIFININSSSTGFYPTLFHSNGKSDTVFENIHAIYNGVTLVSTGMGIGGNNLSISNITIQSATRSSTTASFSGNNHTISNVVLGGYTPNASYAALCPGGNNHSISDLYIIGGTMSLMCNKSTFTNFHQKYSNVSGVQINNAVDNTFDNCSIGYYGANTTADLYHNTNYFSTITFNNTYLGNGGVHTNISNSVPGTYAEFHNYNETVGDHRTWKTYATFVTDSPYTNLHQELTGATYAGSHQFDLLSQTIATKEHYLVATAQISNAAYYGGVHEDPKIDIYADGDITTPLETLTFNDSDTSAHTKSVAFTPTTSNNKVSLKLSTKSDATSANTDVLWSDIKIVARTYGDTFASQTLKISETLTYPIATLTTPTSNGYITEANSATVAAYTGFTIDHATQTCTIASDHTLAELYDYSQYDLGTADNVIYDEWFTTIDGVNYTSTYDIVLNNGVDLTGGGSVDVGAGTFTKTGTATYDGIIIYSASREVHVLLTGLVAGTRVQIYDTDGSSELYNGTTSGTSLDYIYTYTADTDIRIRAIYVDGSSTAYEWYTTTGTITENGFALVVAQVANTVYTDNAVDGSAVTECSISGETIRIYVDDPDNTTSAQRIYNWYQYYLFTEAGIAEQDGAYVTATDSTHYVFADTMKIINSDTANPLNLTGANITPATGAATNIFDLTNGASIALNFERVEFATGMVTTENSIIDQNGKYSMII